MNSSSKLQEPFNVIFNASRQELAVPWPTRKRRLEQLQALLKEHQDTLLAAIATDFGQRSATETTILELIPSNSAIKHALKHGEKWMRRRKVPTSWLFKPAMAYVQPQPKGVIGIVSPWNYPLFLIIGPLVDAFVAGNRAMVKISEHVPKFAETMANLVSQYFQADELTIVTGGVEVASAFSALPFDHLLFTGSTGVGKHVMHAAANNLTPVTLELGGKSPVIIATDADLPKAVERIMYGKMINAGQTCIAPDYVLLQHSQLDEFLRLAQVWFNKHYPNWDSNTDFTRIINSTQLERLQTWLNEANSKGAKVLPLAKQRADFLTPCLVHSTPDSCQLMQQEIFGPILPIVTVDSVQAAIDYINVRPRPLACYVFAEQNELIEQCVRKIVAGGMCINDVVLHVAQDALPFGGIGPSGMGSYHGKTGFETMSHMKGVFVQKPKNMVALMAPPYGKRVKTLLKFLKH